MADPELRNNAPPEEVPILSMNAQDINIPDADSPTIYTEPPYCFNREEKQSKEIQKKK